VHGVEQGDLLKLGMETQRFCFTNKKETMKTARPIKKRRRPSGSERANETEKQ
jgi:hypothetical protein